MKPRVKLAETRTPRGSAVALYRHDDDFSLTVDGNELMNSRRHESELELARLGCAHLSARAAPRVLVGGLGLGYTLRQALDMLPATAEVTVAELLPELVQWNREILGELAARPLDDARVTVKSGDVLELIRMSPATFDAILLDIDNGPHAMTDAANIRLYTRDGIDACRDALRDRGCLAVWSAEPSKTFERLMVGRGLHVRRYRVPAYKGSKTQARFVWVASRDRKVLPPGGGEPLTPPRRSTGPHRGPPWRAARGRN